MRKKKIEKWIYKKKKLSDFFFFSVPVPLLSKQINHAFLTIYCNDDSRRGIYQLGVSYLGSFYESSL